MDKYINGGRYFSIVYQISALAAAGAVELGLTAPATGNIHLLPFSVSTSANTVQASLYENISYTGGSAVTPVNLNRNTSAAATLTASKGATATTSGTPLDTVMATTSSGTVKSSLPTIVLDQGILYVLEITNIGATTATNVDVVVTFYERDV